MWHISLNEKKVHKLFWPLFPVKVETDAINTMGFHFNFLIFIFTYVIALVNSYGKNPKVTFLLDIFTH